MGVGGARAAAGRGRRGVPALNAGVARGASTEKSVYLSRCPRALRDGADFIITNPPFSLFREFLTWVVAGGQRFAVIGSINAITYREAFLLIRANRMWLGARGAGRDMVFGVPEGAEVGARDRAKAARLGYAGNYTRLVNACWFTNLEHGRRHEPLGLMTAADNLRFSRHREIRGRAAYPRYDNHDAIEVPYVDAIPSDYDGVMGVPITFLDRYCPEQFEILGSNRGIDQDAEGVYGRSAYVDGVEVFKRIFIRKRS